MTARPHNATTAIAALLLLPFLALAFTNEKAAAFQEFDDSPRARVQHAERKKPPKRAAKKKPRSRRGGTGKQRYIQVRIVQPDQRVQDEVQPAAYEAWQVQPQGQAQAQGQGREFDGPFVRPPALPVNYYGPYRSSYQMAQASQYYQPPAQPVNPGMRQPVQASSGAPGQHAYAGQTYPAPAHAPSRRYAMGQPAAGTPPAPPVSQPYPQARTSLYQQRADASPQGTEGLFGLVMPSREDMERVQEHGYWSRPRAAGGPGPHWRVEATHPARRNAQAEGSTNFY